MKLLVVLDFRFTVTPDGQVWTRTAHSSRFWDRYLRVFDGVKILARAESRPHVDEKYSPVLGPGVSFVSAPRYLGPWQYAKVRHKIRDAVRAACSPQDAVLCRVVSQLATDLLPDFWQQQRPYGLEVIGDPYESLAPGAVRHPLRPFLRHYATNVLKKQCSRAAAVSYVTESTLQRRYPAARNSLSIAVSDVDLPSDSFSDRSNIRTTRDDYAPPPRTRADTSACRLLFVGSLAQMYKGPDTLIHAVQLLLERGVRVELTMVGDGRHREELENLAQTSGVSAVTRFLGELPAGESISEQLDRATLMVLPSRTEGLPRVIIEAMARAVPCVASNVGGIPELLDSRYLVRPNDPVALANRIQEVISTPDLLQQASEQNWKNAQRFLPEVLEQKRESFYRFLRERTEDWLHSTPERAFDPERLSSLTT